MSKIKIQDIASLTDNSKKHWKRLMQSGRPEELTINGKAELVVQDDAACQQLLEMVRRAVGSFDAMPATVAK